MRNNKFYNEVIRLANDPEFNIYLEKMARKAGTPTDFDQLYAPCDE